MMTWIETVHVPIVTHLTIPTSSYSCAQCILRKHLLQLRHGPGVPRHADQDATVPKRDGRADRSSSTPAPTFYLDAINGVCSAAWAAAAAATAKRTRRGSSEPTKRQVCSRSYRVAGMGVALIGAEVKPRREWTRTRRMNNPLLPNLPSKRLQSYCPHVLGFVIAMIRCGCLQFISDPTPDLIKWCTKHFVVGLVSRPRKKITFGCR